jgi:hypothetical protein
MDMASDTGIDHMAGLSLPATAGDQERDLYQRALNKGVTPHFTCVEKNLATFLRTPSTSLPPGTDHNRISFKNQLALFRESRHMLDWFWFDSCGHALSNACLEGSTLQTFIDALQNNLKPVGIGFVTACARPTRVMTAEKQYAICTGKVVEKVTTDQLMEVYIDIVKESLNKDFSVCSDIRYKSSSGGAFFMLGVSKNWWGHPPHKPIEVA